MNLPSIHLIPDLCALHNLSQVFVSPGSRCAPITIAFARHEKMHVRSISDERSAAFMALGSALGNKQASILVCTSGTAAANYLPAVIEAWYQQIPLIVLTADRPPEWIDQNDGQSIRQENLYGQHCKKFFQFPVDTTHRDAQWHAQRLIHEAIEMAHSFPAGPVHINIPIREPFYPNGELEKTPLSTVRTEVNSEFTLSENTLIQLQTELANFSNIVLIGGQLPPNDALQTSLLNWEKKGYPVIADVLSNLHHPNFLHQVDFLFSEETTSPDLIITFGKTILSKSLKQYIRKQNCAHWHLQEAGEAADPFQKLSNVIRCSPEFFFQKIKPTTSTFGTSWRDIENSISSKIEKFDFAIPNWNELFAMKQLEEFIPQNSIVHLSNSMAVRYASHLGWGKKGFDLFCNRGTSGIDGSMSTALGHALQTKQPVYFITGDLSFFYDRNALWNNYLPDNFHVIVLNNRGGAIFNMIDGPAKQPEAKEYFITHQPYSIYNTVQDTKGKYWSVENQNGKEKLQEFFQYPHLSFLEIECSVESSTEAFKRFKKNLI